MAGRAPDPYAAHCVELLAPLGGAEARRMFGGWGLYVDGLMIGLIASEQVYFKTDAATRPHWEAAGGRPFVYTRRKDDGAEAATAMSYWTPPEEALESPALMLPWSRLALEAALSARAAKTVRPARKAAGSPAARRKPAAKTAKTAKTG